MWQFRKAIRPFSQIWSHKYYIPNFWSLDPISYDADNLSLVLFIGVGVGIAFTVLMIIGLCIGYYCCCKRCCIFYYLFVKIQYNIKCDQAYKNKACWLIKFYQFLKTCSFLRIYWLTTVCPWSFPSLLKVHLDLL